MAKAKVRCSIGKVKTLQHTASGAIAVDDIVVVNGRVCVAYADIANGDSGQMIYQADEIDAPKASGVTIEAGDDAYWDNGNSVFTNVEGSNILCGIFRQGAGSSATECNLELNNLPVPAGGS